ncbi:MAG: UDP-N-acetylmuramoyl-tripeptide--D-alanyl-D-alanine ligase [Bacteroidetes bacterium]|nr:UDP-N-acetylmuramoyl-tripeptide--D-alanyl-D-alanine ligase [Bacteroidota bacterium]
MPQIEKIYQHYLSNPVVSTDTRAIAPGCIFFALKGPSFNGNAFAKQALEAGASMVVVDETEYNIDERCILVDDSLKTLQQLAAHHRSQLNFPFLAITGSNGKTTTKELIRNVLAKKFNVHATKGNLNNHIGVPLTLLSIPAKTNFAVIEMGANHQKEIEFLCSIAMPDYGLITNVGKAHLEGFGGFEGVKKGKGEMYAHLNGQGRTAFVNTDNEHLNKMVAEYRPENVVSYGTNSNAFCRGELITSEPTLNLTWKCESSFGEIQTQMIGAYNFENILSAICIGSYFRVKPEDMNEAIAAYAPDNSRSQIIHQGTNTIVLDAYNANPSSMEAALRNFEKMQSDSKIICIGDMAELGEESAAEHKRIIDQLKKMDYKLLILVGKNFGAYANEIKSIHFENSNLAADFFKKNLPENSLVLIKGSRSSKMELIIN